MTDVNVKVINPTIVIVNPAEVEMGPKNVPELKEWNSLDDYKLLKIFYTLSHPLQIRGSLRGFPLPFCKQGKFNIVHVLWQL